MSIVELVRDSTHPAWWALTWTFLVPCIALIGYLSDLVPRSAQAWGWLFSTYVAGFVVVPYTVSLATNFHPALLVIWLVIGAPFIYVSRRYIRILILYREGFQV